MKIERISDIELLELILRQQIKEGNEAASFCRKFDLINEEETLRQTVLALFCVLNYIIPNIKDRGSIKWKPKKKLKQRKC
jgi:hypothetical protein